MHDRSDGIADQDAGDDREHGERGDQRHCRWSGFLANPRVQRQVGEPGQRVVAAVADGEQQRSGWRPPKLLSQPDHLRAAPALADCDHDGAGIDDRASEVEQFAGVHVQGRLSVRGQRCHRRVAGVVRGSHPREHRDQLGRLRQRFELVVLRRQGADRPAQSRGLPRHLGQEWVKVSADPTGRECTTPAPQHV